MISIYIYFTSVNAATHAVVSGKLHNEKKSGYSLSNLSEKRVKRPTVEVMFTLVEKLKLIFCFFCRKSSSFTHL